MSFNVIAATCDWLRDYLAVPCSSQVPATRPDEFVTVERTGGSLSLGKDAPNLAVQAWSTTDAKAYSLALAAAEVLRNMREGVPEVCSVEVSSIYAFPDPDSRSYRYQISASMVTRP